MCEAATITAVTTIATTALSTAVGMYAQHEQQKTQEKAATQAAEYNAQVAENEKAQQMQLAQNELAKGAADRSRQQRDAARQLGAMRSDLAASGFEMDSGSALSLLGESAQEAQHDSNIISRNADMAAWQHQVGAVNAGNDGAFARYQKSQAKSGRGASMLAMGGTLLGGIGRGLGQYNSYSQTKTAGDGNDAGIFGKSSGVSSTWSKKNPFAWLPKGGA